MKYIVHIKNVSKVLEKFLLIVIVQSFCLMLKYLIDIYRIEKIFSKKMIILYVTGKKTRADKRV